MNVGETGFLEAGFISGGIPFVAKFDPSFADSLSAWKWKIKLLNGKPYVMRGTSAWKDGKRVDASVLAHRLIMGCTKGDGEIVDHINGDTLDNRRTNLRLVTREQNQWNKGVRSKTGYFGVTKQPSGFMGKVVHRGKTHYCGTHETAEDAAEAVNGKLIELRGEYARLNVVPGGFRATYS